MSRQPESRLQRKIRKALESAFPGSFWFKVHGGPFQRAGLPDLLGCVRGTYIGIEVKMPGKEPTKLQLNVMMRIHAAGGQAGYATSVEEALAYVAAAVG